MARREIIKLTKNETALVIRSDGKVDIVGKKHANVLMHLAGVLYSDNKELLEMIRKNYEDLTTKLNEAEKKDNKLNDEKFPKENNSKVIKEAVKKEEQTTEGGK